MNEDGLGTFDALGTLHALGTFDGVASLDALAVDAFGLPERPHRSAG